MRKGLSLKFSSNAKCKETLLQTGNRIIGEASKHDLIWGTGAALAHRHAANPGVWSGQNLMGKLLQEVRDQLSQA